MSNSTPSIIFNSTTTQVEKNTNFAHGSTELFANYSLPFVSVVAQEVKNPLTTINLSLELLESEITDNTHKIYLDNIKRSSLRIDNLMNLLVKTQAANEMLQEQYSIEQLLDEILEMNADRIIHNNISVSKDYATDDFEIVMNKPVIKIALSNIIINAIEAMAPQKGELQLITKSSGGKHIVIIKDNGCGISKVNLPHIFIPHHTSKPCGLGLGLALSYDILRSKKVAISVESEEGIGTNFTLCFNKN